MGLFDRFLKWKKEDKIEEVEQPKAPLEIEEVQQEPIFVTEIEPDAQMERETTVEEVQQENIYQAEQEPIFVTEIEPDAQIKREVTVEEVQQEEIEISVEEAPRAVEMQASITEVEQPKQEMEVSAVTYEKAMEKPRKTLLSGISGLMSRFNKVDEEYFEELEDILIMADIGLPTVQYLIEQLENVARRQSDTTPETLTPILIEEMERIYLTNIQDTTSDIQLQPNDLSVMLFIGVNGAGKTTTIAKMAYKLKQEGKKVLVAAGDTFRAGAVDQLAVWANRVDVDIVKSHTGGDAAAIIFDGIKKAKAEGYDVLLCDTAGRLQNKVNLMNELDKIYRIIQREIPDAPHETLLVIDGTTGQNGLSQAKEFAKVARITGTVVTKLDGSAKGGIVLAIAHELHIPVKLVGLGEKPELLAQFEIDKYLYGLFADLIKE